MLMRPSLNGTNCSTGCNMELKEKLQPSSLNKTLFFAGMHQDQITSVLSIIRFARRFKSPVLLKLRHALLMCPDMICSRVV